MYQITPVQAVPRPAGATSIQIPAQPVPIPKAPSSGGSGVRVRPRTINN